MKDEDDHRRIMRESALQNARVHRWEGWDWKAYQAAIIRGNYRMSELERVLQTVLEHCEGKGWRSDHVAALIRKTVNGGE